MKFKIEASRWHGCAYQTVRPSDTEGVFAWQHRLEWHSWCTESFGPAGDVWEPVPSRWYYNNSRLFFRRPADVTAFLLRWS